MKKKIPQPARPKGQEFVFYLPRDPEASDLMVDTPSLLHSYRVPSMGWPAWGRYVWSMPHYSRLRLEASATGNGRMFMYSDENSIAAEGRKYRSFS